MTIRNGASQPEPIDLRGRTILVTGAGGGIGAATSRVLGASGANVVVSDITDAGAETAEAIVAAGGSAIFVRADVSMEAQVEALVDSAVERFGRLDGAFNNAGVEQSGTPLHLLTEEMWNRAIGVDLTGVFFCIKHEVRAMLSTGGGSIVNTASSLGQTGSPNASEYVAAKHGVVGLSRAAAADYGPDRIRVNAILPGVIETPMVARIAADPAFADGLERVRARHMLGRFGDPVEIGDTVAWLLSDHSSFVTGTALAVDGGYLAS